MFTALATSGAAAVFEKICQIVVAVLGVVLCLFTLFEVN